MKTIGLLGAGQLAALIAHSALKREVTLVAYCQSLNEPAVSYCDTLVQGPVNDRERLLLFFEQCDVILLENEFFDVDLLRDLQTESGVMVYPHLDDYEKLYHKKNQKEFIRQTSIAYAKTFDLSSDVDFDSLSYPMILKKAHGGYDGYGNAEVNNKDRIGQIIGNESKDLFFLEEKLDIEKEFACLLVKGKEDSYIYDPCETVQVDHKCLFVNDQPEQDREIKEKIREAVEELDNELKGPGIYAFEFFYTRDKRIIFNEAAPRVHNSYHFSMEGYTYSQFDLFLNAVLDEELYIPERKYSHLTMLNIIGREEGHYQLSFPYRESLSPYKIHMYGKELSRPGRKLGHITFYDSKETFSSAQWVREEYQL